MNVAALALLGATVWALMSFFRYLTNQEWNAAVTLAGTWIIGVVVLFVSAQTTLVGSFEFSGVTLKALNSWDKIVLGMQATALFANVPWDLKKALDQNDSAKVPSLLPNSPPPAA